MLDQLVEVEVILACVGRFAVLVEDVSAETGLHSLVQYVQAFQAFLVLFQCELAYARIPFLVGTALVV